MFRYIVIQLQAGSVVKLQSGVFLFCVTGKWHLGTRPGHHPLDKGFHSYLGVPYSVDMGCADPPGANLPPCPACPEGKVVQKLNEIGWNRDALHV